MENIKEVRKVRKAIDLLLPIAGVLLFLLFAVMVILLIIRANLVGSERMLKTEIEKTKTQIESIEDEIEYRKSSDYIEKYFREQLGYREKDETKYIPG